MTGSSEALPPKYSHVGPVSGSPIDKAKAKKIGSLKGYEVKEGSTAESTQKSDTKGKKTIEEGVKDASTDISQKKVKHGQEDELSSAVDAQAQSNFPETEKSQKTSVAEKWLSEVMSAPLTSKAEDSRRAMLHRNLGFLQEQNAVPFKDSYLFSGVALINFSSSNKTTWTEAFVACRENLAEQLETFTPIIESDKEAVTSNSSDPRNKLYELANKLKTPKDAIQNGLEIKKTKGGFGGAHFCKSTGDPPKVFAILKSVNGDVATIDNIKGLHHPFQKSEIRPTTNYESVQKEVLAYELSLAFGCEGSVPPTILTVVEHDFHSFFNNPKVDNVLRQCPNEVKAEIISRLGGPPSPERLCCIQQAIPNPKELNDILMNWGSDSYEAREFNQESFEDVMHMTRVLGETDGHADNYLVTVKDEQYVLAKVDSGFGLPNKTMSALNSLTSLPNAQHSLSRRYREKVLASDPDKLEELATKFHLNQDEIAAAKERIQFMKDLVSEKPDITHREFELRLRLFSGMGYGAELKDALLTGTKELLMETGHSESEAYSLMLKALETRVKAKGKSNEEIKLLLASVISSERGDQPFTAKERKEIDKLWKDQFTSAEYKSYASRREFALQDYTPEQLKHLKARNRAKYKATDSEFTSTQTKPGGLAKTARPWKRYKKRAKAKEHINNCSSHITEIRETLTETTLGQKLSEKTLLALSHLETEIEKSKDALSSIEEMLVKISRNPLDTYIMFYPTQKKEMENMLRDIQALENELIGIKQVLEESEDPQEITLALENAVTALSIEEVETVDRSVIFDVDRKALGESGDAHTEEEDSFEETVGEDGYITPIRTSEGMSAEEESFDVGQDGYITPINSEDERMSTEEDSFEETLGEDGYITPEETKGD